MKLNKVNGLYRKPRLRDVRVPKLLPIILVLLSIFGFVFLLTNTHFSLKQQEQLSYTPIRKHFFKIVAVGDIACNPADPNFNEGKGIGSSCQFAAVSKAIEKEKADAVLLLGDIQYDKGVFEDFEKSFVPYFRNITQPIYPVPGNHDYGLGNKEGYDKAFELYFPSAYKDTDDTPGYYKVDIGPAWRLFGLNSNCEFVGGCGQDSKQLNWLNAQLQTDTKPCTLAFWHHPVFTSGQHNTEPDIVYGRDFWKSLLEARADVVLNGHDHDYERFAPQDSLGNATETGVRGFVVGTGGYSLRSFGAPIANQEKAISTSNGYLVMKLYPGRYEWQYKSTDAKVLDDGGDRCHAK